MQESDVKGWSGGWNPVSSSSGRVEGGTGTQGAMILQGGWIQSLLWAPQSSSRGTGKQRREREWPTFCSPNAQSLRLWNQEPFSTWNPWWGLTFLVIWVFTPVSPAQRVLSACPVYSNCLSQVRPELFRSHPISSTELFLFSQLILIFVFTRLRCTSLLGSRALVGLVHYCSVPPDTRVKFKNDVLNESMNQCIWNTVDKICMWENPGNREWRQNMGRIIYILGKIRPLGKATRKVSETGQTWSWRLSEIWRVTRDDLVSWKQQKRGEMEFISLPSPDAKRPTASNLKNWTHHKAEERTAAFPHNLTFSSICRVVLKGMCSLW